MKVAVLSRFALPYHNYGGLERHLYYLIKHLLLKGEEVYLFIQKPFYSSNVFHTYPNFHPEFIDHFRLPFGRIKRTIILDRITNYPMLCRKMAKLVVRRAGMEKLDIVHAHGLTSFGYAQYKRRRPQELPPMIMNPHGLEEFKTKSPLKNLLYAPFRHLVRLGAQLSQKVIATDRCTFEEVNQFLNVPPDKITILPNGVDIDECLAYIDNEVKENLIERFSLYNRSIILLSVGRLERNKGYHFLIEALASVREELPPNWCWLLVGEGSDKKMLEKKIKIFGLSSNVLMVGSLDDSELHNLYELSHAFIHPTLYEGSSIVTLEAMVHKCPIVASATGGLPDKVKNGFNGFLSQPGDADDLGKKILMLVKRKEDFPLMGENSLNIVKKEFSWDTIIQQYIKIYRDMIKEGK